MAEQWRLIEEEMPLFLLDDLLLLAVDGVLLYMQRVKRIVAIDFMVIKLQWQYRFFEFTGQSLSVRLKARLISSQPLSFEGQLVILDVEALDISMWIVHALLQHTYLPLNSMNDFSCVCVMTPNTTNSKFEIEEFGHRNNGCEFVQALRD